MAWPDAAVRWITEKKREGKPVDNDLSTLRWLDTHLRRLTLCQIDSACINRLIVAKAAEVDSNATVNRMLALVRAILRKADKPWGVLTSGAPVKLLREPKRRIRWLSHDEARTLLTELPEHLAAMAGFSLATGLRAGNVLGLEWSQIDMARRVAWVHPDQAKAGQAIPVPLNGGAVAVLRLQVGKHPTRVFTYQGQPIGQHNTKAWKKALGRAGIKDFRWHDLRHTWASWHIQAGTDLEQLRQLGGWSNLEMVLKYAHLNPKHLASAADNIGTILTQSEVSPVLKAA
jgi:integrase